MTPSRHGVTNYVIFPSKKRALITLVHTVRVSPISFACVPDMYGPRHCTTSAERRGRRGPNDADPGAQSKHEDRAAASKTDGSDVEEEEDDDRGSSGSGGPADDRRQEHVPVVTSESSLPLSYSSSDLQPSAPSRSNSSELPLSWSQSLVMASTSPVNVRPNGNEAIVFAGAPSQAFDSARGRAPAGESGAVDAEPTLSLSAQRRAATTAAAAAAAGGGGTSSSSRVTAHDHRNGNGLATASQHSSAGDGSDGGDADDADDGSSAPPMMSAPGARAPVAVAAGSAGAAASATVSAGWQQRAHDRGANTALDAEACADALAAHAAPSASNHPPPHRLALYPPPPGAMLYPAGAAGAHALLGMSKADDQAGAAVAAAGHSGEDGGGSDAGGAREDDEDDDAAHDAAGADGAAQAQAPMTRKGKWSSEEERYAMRIIQLFHAGILGHLEEDVLTPPQGRPGSSGRARRGQSLRAYLAEKLNCDPMRITKKFASTSCLGKSLHRVQHLRSGDAPPAPELLEVHSAGGGGCAARLACPT